MSVDIILNQLNTYRGRPLNAILTPAVNSSPQGDMGRAVGNTSPSEVAISNPVYGDTSRKFVKDDDVDEDEIAEKAGQSSNLWACDAEGTMFWASTPTAATVPPGLYKCIYTDRTGNALRKLIVSTDDLIVLDDDAATTKVAKEIERFWLRKANYRQMGLLHKRGILMYGDPGSGKTSVVQQLIKKLIDRGGIAIYADDPHLLTASLQILRRIEPDRPVIVVLEDFETLTERSQRENEWLSVLDGEAQINNVVFLATTNYIKKLDKRFTDRPSRFDTIMKVPMPSAKTRAVYLTSKLGFLDDEELLDLIHMTSQMSIAHLKELVVATFCLNDGETMTRPERAEIIAMAMDKLREMQKRTFSEDDTAPDMGSGFGFTAVAGPAKDGTDLDMDEIRRLAKTFKRTAPAPASKPLPAPDLEITMRDSIEASLSRIIDV